MSCDCHWYHPSNSLIVAKVCNTIIVIIIIIIIIIITTTTTTIIIIIVIIPKYQNNNNIIYIYICIYIYIYIYIYIILYFTYSIVFITLSTQFLNLFSCNRWNKSVVARLVYFNLTSKPWLRFSDAFIYIEYCS